MLVVARAKAPFLVLLRGKATTERQGLKRRDLQHEYSTVLLTLSRRASVFSTVHCEKMPNKSSNCCVSAAVALFEVVGLMTALIAISSTYWLGTFCPVRLARRYCTRVLYSVLVFWFFGFFLRERKARTQETSRRIRTSCCRQVERSSSRRRPTRPDRFFLPYLILSFLPLLSSSRQNSSAEDGGRLRASRRGPRWSMEGVLRSTRRTGVGDGG